jgi:hypothetical protein
LLEKNLNNFELIAVFGYLGSESLVENRRIIHKRRDMPKIAALKPLMAFL